MRTDLQCMIHWCHKINMLIQKCSCSVWCSSLLALFWCFFVCVFNCTRPNRVNILYTLLQTKWAKSIRYFRQQMLNVISDKKCLEMIPYMVHMWPRARVLRESAVFFSPSRLDQALPYSKQYRRTTLQYTVQQGTRNQQKLCGGGGKE